VTPAYNPRDTCRDSKISLDNPSQKNLKILIRKYSQADEILRNGCNLSPPRRMKFEARFEF
jgi:hypothetical protein